MALVKGNLYRRKDDKAIGYFLGDISPSGRYLFGATPNIIVSSSWSADIDEVEEVIEKHPLYDKYILVYTALKRWEKRILVDTAKKGVLCVSSNYEEEYRKGELFTTIFYKEWKPIQEKRKVTLELTEEQIGSIKYLLGEDLC